MMTCFQVYAQNYYTIEAKELNTRNFDNPETTVLDSSLLINIHEEQLKKFLLSAPAEQQKKAIQPTINLTLPDPEGNSVKYALHHYPIVAPHLLKKYPDIQVFKGVAKNDPTNKIVLGISNKGFYATSRKPGETYSIELTDYKDQKRYKVFRHQNHETADELKACGVDIPIERLQEKQISRTRNEGTLDLQVYRVAISATGEFSARFGPTKGDVLASIISSLARVNLIYENDLSIRLVLVDNNDELIFLNKDTDPFPEGNRGGALLSANTGVISDIIGFANYDIGHVYTGGCSDVGGIASLNSVCSGNKGNGVSCFSSSNIASTSVRIVAHEMGHQFGAPHTFNNCNGNESSGTAFEPGSGSTIMSYGGLCGSDLNVVTFSDDYYHVNSLIRIKDYMRDGFGNNCASYIETGNHFPEIIMPYEDGFFIPVGTPFELEASATDEDGDTLSYVWEEYDLGPSTILGEPVGNSPLFRSVYPSSSPKRVFPNIQTIIDNKFDKNEVLPDYTRDLTFQFVVRDNHFANGAVSWATIAFEATETAGPFIVQFPNEKDTFKVGEEIDILWDVANTSNNLINCKSVDIYLSLDGGYNYDILLLEKTANDGMAKVFIPNNITDQARIKIKASDNIFFDISNENFTIEAPDEPGFTASLSPGYLFGCVPTSLTFEFKTSSLLDYNEDIQIEITSELPEGVEVSFNRSTLSPEQVAIGNILFTDTRVSGAIAIDIQASSISDTIRRTLQLDLVSSNFDDLVPLTPEPGSSGNTVSPEFTWTKDKDAEKYIFKISDNPKFDGSGFYFEIETQDSFALLSDILDKSSVYFWKIDAINSCGYFSNRNINTFATEALSCNLYSYNDVPVNITQSVARTIELPIEVFSEGQISDVNIKKIRGTHEWVSELKGELISPSGTSIVLFSNKCGNQSGFNCGFDDDASTEITCPLSQGISFKPQMALDTFVGESIAGIWQFNLTDTKAGNGGTLQEYVLELCSNAALENPVLVNNNILPLPSGLGRRISSTFLLTEDANNDAEELVYTIISLPSYGSLVRNDDTLQLGDQFTQLEILNNVIGYRHDGNSDFDAFQFIVEDGEGGWIDITRFEILIDNDVVLDVDDFQLSNFKIYPNPNFGQFQVTLEEYNKESIFEVYNAQGQNVFKAPVSTNTFEVNLSTLPNGIYHVGIPGYRMQSFVIQK